MITVSVPTFGRRTQVVSPAQAQPSSGEYTPPESLEQLVAKLYQTPPSLIATVKAILPNEK